jgi:hypothetical protein
LDQTEIEIVLTLFLEDVIWLLLSRSLIDDYAEQHQADSQTFPTLKLILLVWGDGLTPARKHWFVQKVRLIDPSGQLFSEYLSGSLILKLFTQLSQTLRIGLKLCAVSQNSLLIFYHYETNN